MSRKADTPPTITEETGPMPGVIKTHPAYGMLSFHRVSGGANKLFGSEIKHNHFIEMTLCPGEEKWSLAQVWHHARSRQLCTVRMSTAQFSELITSMNIGGGVPVTIGFIADEVGERPGIADTDTLHQQIKATVRKEADDAFKDAAALSKRLTELVAASKLTKPQKEELIGMVTKVTAAVQSSLPFVIDQYQEAAEKVGAKAKAELDAYTTAVISRLGEKALAQLNSPAPLPHIEENPS